MAFVTEFSGQLLNVKQMPKGGPTEFNQLDHIATDRDGKLWVFYSREGAAPLPKLFYRTYVADTDTWSSEIEVFPNGAAGTFTSSGVGRSIVKANRDGDIAVLFVLGSSGSGNITYWIRLIRSDGTQEAIKQVPDAGGNITRDLCLANGCYDFTVVDTKGIGPANIRAIDFSSADLTFGNERFLYHATTHGYTLYNYSMNKGRASYNPISNQVHVCTQCNATSAVGADKKLLYCRDGGSGPVLQDLPLNLISDTGTYAVVNPQFCTDNIDGNRGYVTYSINAVTSPANERNGPETLMFREILDDAFGAEVSIHATSQPAFAGGEANGVYVDGRGNIHVMYRHDAVKLTPSIYKFAAPVGSTAPFGYAYRMLPRGSTMWNDEQEVFFSDARTPGSAAYLIFGSGHTDIGTRPFPTLTRIFSAANATDENGGVYDAEEGIYINYADVLEAASQLDGEPLLDCSGQDGTANDVAHRQFLFDERSFSDAQDDLGVQ